MLLSFSDPAAIEEMLRHRERVGGKAVGLARLAERHLAIPPGQVVPVAHFRDFLANNGLDESARRLLRDPDPERLETLLTAIRTAPLRAELLEALAQAGKELGPLMAVRSSSIEEDHHRGSFAGMYHTALGVAPGEPLVRAVRDCWASAFAPRAIAYARKLGLDATPGMGVVIQRLVRARSAGVLFTTNPITGSYREMTVEAVWGLGEAIVGGHLVPDHYLLRRPRRLPETLLRVAARVRLDVLDESVQPQERRLVPVPGGVGWVDVPEQDQRARKLPRDRLLELARIALKVEASAGCPQDIEWALADDDRLYLLQARPVSAAPAPLRGGNVLWTRRFIGERWTEPATPLGWSMIQPLIEHYIAYPETNARFLGNGDPLRLVEGAPYINATVFRHLAFKLPGQAPPRFMMEMLPPDEERSWNDRFAASPDARVYASILRETWSGRRWRRFRWNPLTNHKAWDTLELKLDREIPSLNDPPPSSPTQAMERVEAGMELAREYVKVHVTSLLFANLLYQIVGNLVRLWAGREGEQLARDLLCCPAENLTMLTNRDLWSLAGVARSERVDLSTVPSRESTFGNAFHRFLDRHGHRCDATWEIMSPRWSEHPERVLELLRRVVETQAEDPSIRARAQTELAERARARLGELVQGGARLLLLRRSVDLTRKYLLLRENQRYHFDRLLFAVKRSLLVVGEWMVREGLCARALDVRLLTAAELESVVGGRLLGEELSALLTRRAEILRRQAEATPPDFLFDDEPLPPSEAVSHRIFGLGASAGIVRGRVRVLRSLEDASRLRPGEILVARSTDPGWTPLFLSARGLVMELGGQLSHGAVVAREYHVPTVVNARSATSILKDGMEITLDGTRGVIWIHE